MFLRGLKSDIFAINFKKAEGKHHQNPIYLTTMVLRWLLILFHFLTCAVVDALSHSEPLESGPSFWNRVQPLLKKSNSSNNSNNDRLEQFTDTVWHVEHGLDPPQKSKLRKGQECSAPFPGLPPGQPFHDVNDFDWSEELTAKHEIVKNELLAYLKRSQASQDDKEINWSKSTTKLCDDTNGFTKLTLQNPDGTPTDIGMTCFSKTLQLLHESNVPLAPRPICINCQYPQTGLAPHSDNMNFLLTCHLGLIVPTDGPCLFRNHDDEYRWDTGSTIKQF